MQARRCASPSAAPATSPIRESRMTSSYSARSAVQLRKSSKKRPRADSPPPSIARSLGAARFSSTPSRQPGDLRLVEQAAHDAGAVAAEVRAHAHRATSSAP